MKIGLLAVPGTNRWLEPLFALAVVAGLGWAMIHLYLYHYLPQPYFYDPVDTWQDWFNTSLWAHDKGAYDSWQSIYPPLSFVFLKVFSTPGCVKLSGNEFRTCDWLGVGAMHGFFILNAVLIARIYTKVDRRTALPRAVALAAGFPATYTLDRGNILIVCFTMFLLAYGPLVRSARLRWLAAALAINFKIYLIASIMPYVFKRRWLAFEGALLATAGVYLVTYAIVGSGTPGQLINNLSGFTGGYQAINILDLWYSMTYGPALSLLNGVGFPISAAIGSDLTGALTVGLALLMHIGQAMILLAFVMTWLRPEAVPALRLVTLGTALALITAEAGGYTTTLILFGVFAEPWRGIGRKWAIVVAYILSIPADIIIYKIPSLFSVRDSFLGGQPVLPDYGVGIGPFLRPGLIISIAVALAAVTIWDVWRDIRFQGWRGRRRFRYDLPVMTGPEPSR